MKHVLILISIGIFFITGCQPQVEGSSELNRRMPGKLKIEDYGFVNGEKVVLYNITFPGKLKAKVTNYGGIVVALEVPDRDGNLGDVVLGYDSLSSYVEKTPYFGAILGRCANRIANGQFSINNKEYKLATNNGPNHLHGGDIGFDKVVWNAKTEVTESGVKVILSYISPDGEEGYPGQLSITVTYTFTENDFGVTYQATTDQTTIVNLSHHNYYNLSACKEDVMNHELQLHASRFLPLDSNSIPTGEFRKVALTPFDFNKPKLIKQDIKTENKQLKQGQGYDHCWVLDKKKEDGFELAGSLYHKKSGRFMECYTTEPGVQIYTANFINGQFKGKNDLSYPKRYGVCLETQHFADSPNQSSFPSVLLNPGETYSSKTVYRFSAK